MCFLNVGCFPKCPSDLEVNGYAIKGLHKSKLWLWKLHLASTGSPFAPVVLVGRVFRVLSICQRKRILIPLQGWSKPICYSRLVVYLNFLSRDWDFSNRTSSRTSTEKTEAGNKAGMGDAVQTLLLWCGSSPHQVPTMLQGWLGPVGPGSRKALENCLSIAARCSLVRVTRNAQSIHLTVLLSSFRHSSAWVWCLQPHCKARGELDMWETWSRNSGKGKLLNMPTGRCWAQPFPGKSGNFPHFG